MGKLKSRSKDKDSGGKNKVKKRPASKSGLTPDEKRANMEGSLRVNTGDEESGSITFDPGNQLDSSMNDSSINDSYAILQSQAQSQHSPQLSSQTQPSQPSQTQPSPQSHSRSHPQPSPPSPMEDKLQATEIMLGQVLHEIKLIKEDSKVSELVKSIEFWGAAFHDIIRDLKEMKSVVDRNEDMKFEIQDHMKDNEAIRGRLRDMENYSRRDNLEIAGVKERAGEDCKQVCRNIFTNELQISKDIAIVRCHRVGKQRDGVARPILLRFQFSSDKELVMKNRAKLKGSGFYLNDDLCSESKRARAKLVPVLKELKIINKKAHFRAEKIFYNGKLYNKANLHDLPVSAHSSCTKTKDGVTVFAASLSRLSNLHPCDLTIDGQQYKSVGHYYQHQKALCTGHKDVAERILRTKEPLDVLFLGKDLVTDGTDCNSK